MKTYLFDLARVILFPKDPNYQGELNAKYKELKDTAGFSFYDHFMLNEELLEHISRNLKGASVCIFTSGSIQGAPELAEKLNIFQCIFSAEELGMSKKEADSFKQLAKLMNKPETEIVFIDDMAENVGAATAAGMTAIQYQNNQQLIEQLAQYA